ADLTGNPGFQSSLSIASKSEDKQYNPFEHRTVQHPNTTIGSILHLLKACLGSGILAMPAAFKNSGLLIGVADFYFPELQLSIQTYCALTLVPLVLEREMVASVSTWPLFLSTVIFAMEGIGVVMPVENEMAHPEKFLGCPGVLNTAMVIVICSYGVVGFFGYVQFGDAVKGSVTLNLPQDDIGAEHQTFNGARDIPVIHDPVLRPDGDDHKDSQEAELGQIREPVVDTVYRWDRDLGWMNWILWKNIIIAIISMVCLVSGGYVSVVGMIDEFYLNDDVVVHDNNTTLTLT
ncbi:Amino acid transporter, partial [Operophtera brumata]